MEKCVNGGISGHDMICVARPRNARKVCFQGRFWCMTLTGMSKEWPSLPVKIFCMFPSFHDRYVGPDLAGNSTIARVVLLLSRGASFLGINSPEFSHHAKVQSRKGIRFSPVCTALLGSTRSTPFHYCALASLRDRTVVSPGSRSVATL